MTPRLMENVYTPDAKFLLKDLPAEEGAEKMADNSSVESSERSVASTTTLPEQNNMNAIRTDSSSSHVSDKVVRSGNTAASQTVPNGAVPLRRRESAQSTKPKAPEKNMWCSWCLVKTKHTMTKSNLFGRDQWKCKDCWGFGKICIACGAATGKEYANGDTDKLCMSCSGAISIWGEKKLVTEHGWCSWCFNETDQMLEQKNLIGRNVYKCTNEKCGRRTLKCTDCLYIQFQQEAPDKYKKTEVFQVGFARGDVNEGDDKWCAVHDGTIEAWGDSPHEIAIQLARERYCSWCIQWTTHRFEKMRYVGRDAFVCGECSMPTLVCYSCDSGMAMGGSLWDDRTCAVCQGLAFKFVAEGTELVNGRVLESTIIETSARQSLGSRKSLTSLGEVKEITKAAEVKSEENLGAQLPKKVPESAAGLSLFSVKDEDIAAFTDTWEKIITRKFNTYRDMFDLTPSAKPPSTTRKRENSVSSVSSANQGPVSLTEDQSPSPAPGRRVSLRPNVGIIANKDTWEGLITRKQAVFSQPWGVEEIRMQLSRQSPERKKAMESGMIRPFLYLVSMHASLRNRVSNLLGWSLVADACFGDPHREAWEIIQARTGFLGRAQEFSERIDSLEPDWMTVLYRVLQETFPGEPLPNLKPIHVSKQLSRSSATTLEPALEETGLQLLVEFSKRQLTKEQIQDQERNMGTEEAKVTMATMCQHSAIQDSDVLQYGTIMVLGANTLKKTKQAADVLGNVGKVASIAKVGVIATPLTIVSSAIMAVKIGQLAMGSSAARLFGPLVMLIQQRLALGALGIDIAEYY